MDQIAFHLHEMTRHFEAGRFASARWHCRIWTRLVAGVKFSNDGTEASGQHISCRAGMPSPYQDRNAQAEARQEQKE